MSASLDQAQGRHFVKLTTGLPGDGGRVGGGRKGGEVGGFEYAPTFKYLMTPVIPLLKNNHAGVCTHSYFAYNFMKFTTS